MQEKMAISNCNSFEHVAEFKQFRRTVTNPICTQEESKYELNSADDLLPFLSELYVFLCDF